MQSSQSALAEVEPLGLGPVDRDVDTLGSHFVQNLPGEAARAKAVDDRAHVHAAMRRSHQCIGYAAPAGVVGEDVRLEVDLALRGIDRRLERRKVLDPAMQERDAIALAIFVHINAS